MIDLAIDAPDKIGTEIEIRPLGPAERITAIGEVFDVGAGRVGPLPFSPRRLIPGETVNDADEPIGSPIDIPLDDYQRIESSLDLTGEPRPAIAIDASIAHLGTTPIGTVTAFRAACVLSSPGRQVLYLARPGMIHTTEANTPDLLYRVGADLGDPEHYVHAASGQPLRLKGGHVTPHQVADRFRNYLERQLQFFAIEEVAGGIVAVDGALTADTWDTPPALMRLLATKAQERGNHLVGVSKQSSITVNSREIRYALHDAPPGPRFRDLTDDLRVQEERLRAQGVRVRKRAEIPLHVFAARFSYVGATYRVDVLPAPGYEAREALASFFGSTLMKAGYPDVLVRAHLHCYFTWPDLIALQAAATRQFGFRLQPQVTLAAAFQPFGGRWK